VGRIKEPLNAGVMTGPDPAVLPQGVLSSMRNAVYRPESQALQRARGRTAFGTVTASAADINGLRDMQFDNGDHYLIAQTSAAAVANYSTAFVGDTGTWGVLTTAVTAGTQLEVIHYNNRFFVMNGVSAVSSAVSVAGGNASAIISLGTNSAIYLSSTAASSSPVIRQHGMMPVFGKPGTATSTALPAVSATGFYEYWTTEVYKYQQDSVQQELEGTFVGDPETVFVGSTATSATVIYMPSLTNAIATHWRVYRSPIKTYSTDRVFPDGFMIAEAAVATTAGSGTATVSIVDSSTSTVGSYVFPSAFDASTTFVSATRLSAADEIYASGIQGAGSPPPPAYQQCYGFNFGGFRGPVLGIQCEMKAYTDSGTFGVPISVYIGKRQSNGQFQAGLGGKRTAIITATAAGQVATIGSSTDPWAASDATKFVDTDFDSNFMAALESRHPIHVDYIRLRVNYGASVGAGSVTPFSTVVYTFGDIVAQVGKNGVPPSSSTGDIYQDCLVVNDVASPKIIRYSFPGLPEYFPGTYYLDFQTADNDEITCIKVVNNRLVVGLLHSIWRVNYLPSERDASFDRGLAKEPISRNYGIVNSMCAAVFSPDGITEVLAFVSEKGIHFTQAYGASTQTSNQNWRQILSTTSGITSNAIALINDPENQELLFYYRNDELDPETYMCLHLAYGLNHVGTLHSDQGPSRTFETAAKISGPVHMRNYHSGSTSYAGLRSAWAVPRANGDTGIYLGYGAASGAGATAAGAGVVYRETGANIPANDPAMRYITRRMYLADESGEARLNELYGYCGSNATAGGAPALVYTALTTKTNDDSGETTQSAATASLGGRKMHKVQFRNICEGLRVSAAVTANQQNDIAQEFILLDGENFGAEDSGV